MNQMQCNAKQVTRKRRCDLKSEAKQRGREERRREGQIDGKGRMDGWMEGKQGRREKGGENGKMGGRGT